MHFLLFRKLCWEEQFEIDEGFVVPARAFRLFSFQQSNHRIAKGFAQGRNQTNTNKEADKKKQEVKEV